MFTKFDEIDRLPDNVKKIYPHKHSLRGLYKKVSRLIIPLVTFGTPWPSKLNHTTLHFQNFLNEIFNTALMKNNYIQDKNTLYRVFISRATEILKSKSVRSTDDVIDFIRTWIRQSQIVKKTLHFHPKVYQKLIIFLIQSSSSLL